MNLLSKKREFSKICHNIKSVRIQGARNIASAALKAYLFFPSAKSKKQLLSLRPTEPMMKKVLDLADNIPEKEILFHFEDAQNRINKNVLKLINSHEKIFTHCHSTNVMNALIYSKKKGKKFEVYNTETRPLFQGRKTSNELSRAGIKVTQFVDSAFAFAIEKENKSDKISVDKIFLGADALLNEGIINKIGSRTIAELAHINNIPLYIIADSWKYSKEKIPIEMRSLNEIWGKVPKKIKIQNPSFEFVPKKYITKVVSEFGILSYGDFLRKVS